VSGFSRTIADATMPLNCSQRPDRVEQIVRVVCGAVFGSLFGFVVALNLALSSALQLVVLVAVFALVCAVLALRFGDRFWYSLRHVKWFFWP